MKEFEVLSNALQEMIDGKNTMNVPAREDEDADLILAQGIKEHKEMQNLIVMIRDDLIMRADDDCVVNISDFIWERINEVVGT